MVHNTGNQAEIQRTCACFGKYLYIKELKGVNGFLDERRKEKENKERGRDGERWLCSECPLTGKYCIIIILFSGTCSKCSNPLPTPLSLSMLLCLSPFSVSTQPYHCLLKSQCIPAEPFAMLLIAQKPENGLSHVVACCRMLSHAIARNATKIAQRTQALVGGNTFFLPHFAFSPGHPDKCILTVLIHH